MENKELLHRVGDLLKKFPGRADRVIIYKKLISSIELIEKELQNKKDRKEWGKSIEILRKKYPERAHPDGHFFID